MQALQPCPFCQKADQLKLRWRVKGGHFIECTYCLASGPRWGDEQECTDDWNKAPRSICARSAVTALAEAGFIENLDDAEIGEIATLISKALTPTNPPAPSKR